MYIYLFQCNLISSLDISEKISFSARHEHDCLSFGTSTTGTTDSVDIRLWILRYVVVDYEHDILHIEPSSRNVGCYEYITKSILESLEGSGSISLLHISMETSGRESISLEHIGDILGFVFHPAEYYDLHILMVEDVFFEHLVFLEMWNFDKRMVYL